MNIVPAGLGKRTGAAILDILIAALVWFGLLAYAIQPIFNSLYNTYTIQEAYQGIQVASKLYEQDPDYLTISVLAKEDYASGVLAYYTNFKEETNEWYNAEILKIGTEDSLFVYAQTAGVDDPTLVGVPAPIEGSGSMTSEQLSSATAAQNATLETFYYNAYAAAIDDLNGQADYAALANQLATYFRWELVIATVFVLLVFYFMIPMLLKDGRTLGKQILGLSLVTKQGYKVNKLQITLRFLVFGIFEIFGSVYTMMGTILISYTIMIFGKKNMSVHDFAASTRVIDGKRSVWFKNADEAAAYQAELDKQPKQSVLGSFVPEAIPAAPETPTAEEPKPTLNDEPNKDEK